MRERAPHNLLLLASVLLGALLCVNPARAQLFPPPVAQADGPISVTEDTARPIPFSDLLGNDDLGFPPAQTVTIFTSPANGSLVATPPGSFTYTPNLNYNGPDSFVYELSNGFGASTATVTLTVTPVNDAPSGVVDRSYGASENTPLSVPAPGLLAGVTDPEGDAVSVQIVTNVPAAAGSVALTGANGAFTYTPAQGFTGSTTFTYRAVDNATPSAASDAATVTINVANVNDAPVANPDAYNATEDIVLDVPAAQGVLANDTDPDAGTTLTTTAGIVQLTPQNAGALQLAANGSFRYTPALNFSGTATFTYRARDNGTPPLDSEPATVTITVAAVNDAPIAVADVYEANVGIALTVPAPGVLVNDTDVEGNALTAQIVASVAPATGTLALSPNGGFTYTPAAGFEGDASFTYRALDNGTPNALSAQPATVTIHVRNAPPAFAPGITAIPEQTATENVPFTVDLSTFFVDPEGAPLTFTITGLPAGLTPAANGTISGTPIVAASVGTFPINVVVSDGPNQLTASFTLRVLEAGRTDIAVAAAASPSPALLNESIAWTFTVENRSSVENVGNVSLEVSFVGPGAFPVSAPAPCVVNAQGDRTTMTCSPIGPVLAGGQTTITATGSSALAGDVLVIAQVKIVDPTPLDETPQNDTVVEAVSVGETAAAGPAQTISVTDLTSAAAGDFNGDGFIDLAVATSSGAAIYANAADPAAPDSVKRVLGTPRVPVDSAPSIGLAAADFDGDGALDLAIARATGPSVVLRNPKDGSFALAATAAAIGRAGDASNAIAARDLDGDGLVDIVLANRGANRVYMNRGGGAFAEVGSGLGNDDSRDVAIADFGGDAALDIVFANADGNATLYYYAAGSYVETRLETGATTSVAAGDVNGDGRPDLVFGGAQSKSVFFNVTAAGGTPQFASTPVQLGTAPTADVLLEDTDVDGDLDVVAINTSGGHQVYANGGTGQFTLRPQQFASNGPRHATVAKLGADDRVDVAVVGSASLDIFYNDGFGNFGRGDVGAPILQLTGPASIDVTVEAVYTDAGATAIDAADGDITSRIQVDNPVNTAVVGTYTVTYNVTDSSGNAAAPVTRTVRVGVRTGTGGGGGGAIDLATLLSLAILMFGAVWSRTRRRNV